MICRIKYYLNDDKRGRNCSTCVVEKKEMYRVLVGNPKEGDHLEDDRINMALREIRWHSVD